MHHLPDLFHPKSQRSCAIRTTQQEQIERVLFKILSSALHLQISYYAKMFGLLSSKVQFQYGQNSDQ